MGQTPSIPTDLTKEVQVIGAGFSRTGTVSFTMALERLLDGPVCHSGTGVLKREPAYVKTWLQIQDPSTPHSTRLKLLREVTRGYVALTDIPANCFVSELCEIYPSALVICTTRDADAWSKSAAALNDNTMKWYLSALLLPMPTLRYFVSWTRSIARRLEIIYGVKGEEMEGPKLLRLHNEYVERVAPKDKLHFLEVKEGWEPLCRVLGKEVPDEKFPRANDMDAMQKFFEGVCIEALGRWAGILATTAAVGVGVWWRFRRP